MKKIHLLELAEKLEQKILLTDKEAKDRNDNLQGRNDYRLSLITQGTISEHAKIIAEAKFPYK